MILREATIKYAGYDPNELKPKSQRRVCIVCDKCGRVRWQPKALIHDLCKSCAAKLRFSRKEEIKLASERQLERYKNNPAPKGKDNPLYGRTLSTIHKQKIGEAQKGHGFTEETLEKLRGERVERIIKLCPICETEFLVLPHKDDRIYCSNKCYGESNKGENNPAKRPEVRKLISEKTTGLKTSPEAIQNLKASHRTEKYLEKMGGCNNPSWKGGISLDDYCNLFNLPLKEAIRLYFNLNCFMDNEPEDNGRALSVHHVNYDKRCGCGATQLCIFIPVKAKWNAIFNGNKERNRWYWYSFLMNKIFIEHPNYFTYHIPVWGMNELEYNYDYVFEKFRVV